MKVYRVTILDITDKTHSETVCKNENDLSKLIANLDTDAFSIEYVDTADVVLDWLEFCKKFPGETGAK